MAGYSSTTPVINIVRQRDRALGHVLSPRDHHGRESKLFTFSLHFLIFMPVITIDVPAIGLDFPTVLLVVVAIFLYRCVYAPKAAASAS